MITFFCLMISDSFLIFCLNLIFHYFFLTSLKRMPCLRKLKWFFSNFDFFADPKLLTYHDQPEYKTATGGVITIIIFAVTIALVTTEAILLLQRKNVTG